MDAQLTRFLNVVRPGARATHRRVFEEMAWTLDRFLRHRRRRLKSLRPSELRVFLAYWYLRNVQPPSRREAMHFTAAMRLLIYWLSRERTPHRAAELRAESALAGRETARAAHVSELLQDTPLLTEPTSDDADGYWEVMILGDAHAILRDLHARTAVGPVALPPAIVRELRHGSVLNLRLARGPKSWHVVAHGQCYPPVARAALRAASAMPV